MIAQLLKWGDRNTNTHVLKWRTLGLIEMINYEATSEVCLCVTRTYTGACGGVHVLYLWFGKSPVSVKFWSRWPPVKMVLPSLLSLYWEMSPLGWDGWSQYSSTADVFIIRCLGLNQIPGDSDAKYKKI